MRVASRDIAGVDGSLPKSIEGTSTAWVAITSRSRAKTPAFLK